MIQGVSWILRLGGRKGHTRFLHSVEAGGRREGRVGHNQIKSNLKIWKKILWFVVNVKGKDYKILWKRSEATLGRVRRGLFEKSDLKSEDAFFRFQIQTGKSQIMRSQIEYTGDTGNSKCKVLKPGTFVIIQEKEVVLYSWNIVNKVEINKRNDSGRQKKDYVSPLGKKCITQCINLFKKYLLSTYYGAGMIPIMGI